MLADTPNNVFEVFGDESTNGEIVAFGVAIIPSVKTTEIINEIKKIKNEFGAETARIHCKELLHGDRRKRSLWKDLSENQVFDMLINIAQSTHNLGMRAWVGFLDSRTVPKKLFFEDNGEISSMRITNLHHILFSYWATMGPVFDFIPHQMTQGWMDPNRSKVKLINQNKQIRLAQGFFPIHHNNFRFEPNVIDGEKPALLDLADIIVHCAARALTTTSLTGKEKYESVLYALHPGLSVAHFNIPNGPLLSVETKTAAVLEFKKFFHTFQN